MSDNGGPPRLADMFDTPSGLRAAIESARSGRFSAWDVEALVHAVEHRIGAPLSLAARPDHASPGLASDGGHVGAWGSQQAAVKFYAWLCTAGLAGAVVLGLWQTREPAISIPAVATEAWVHAATAPTGTWVHATDAPDGTSVHASTAPTGTSVHASTTAKGEAWVSAMSNTTAAPGTDGLPETPDRVASAPLPGGVSGVARPDPSPRAPSRALESPPGDEYGVLREAREVLRSDPGRALALTNEHRRRFRRGMLVQEREAIAIEALCLLGRNAEAEARFGRLRAQFPSSPYRNRLEGYRPARSGFK